MIGIYRITCADVLNVGDYVCVNAVGKLIRCPKFKALGMAMEKSDIGQGALVQLIDQRGVSLTERVLEFVAFCPGQTAWNITKELSSDPHRDKGTISSLLCRMSGDGRLGRRKNAKGTWTYYALKRRA